MKIIIKSPAFNDGDSIPAKYTHDGLNVSPPLKWSVKSEKIRTFAIILTEAGKEGRETAHWILFNLPGNYNQLHEDVTPVRNVPDEVVFGTNDFGHIGYSGPNPASGTHKYDIIIYALDKALHLEAGATYKDILREIEGCMVAKGKLTGKYKKIKEITS